jgi:hypothetical protein
MFMQQPEQVRFTNLIQRRQWSLCFTSRYAKYNVMFPFDVEPDERNVLSVGPPDQAF